MIEKYYQYLDALKSNCRIAVKIDWLDEGEGTLFEITNEAYGMGGSLSVAMQNGIRASASLKLDNVNNQFPVNPDKIWFDQKLRVNLGAYLSDGTPYYIPKGVFYVRNPQEAYMPSERSMTLDLVDKWSHLDGSLFGNLDGIYQTPAGLNIYQAIASLLKLDRGNGKPLDAKPPLLSRYYLDKTWASGGAVYQAIDLPFTSRVERSGSYADVLLDYAKMLAAHMYYDENGRLVVEPTDEDVTDGSKPIQWEFKLAGNEFLGDSTVYGLENVFNEVLVVGAILNGKQAKGVARNTNIHSQTRVQLIGRKCDKPYEDDNYYADEQCEALARYFLKRKTVLQKSVTITSAPIPHIGVNRLVSIERPGYVPKPEKFLVSAYTIPIGQTGTMSVTATNVNELEFD